MSGERDSQKPDGWDPLGFVLFLLLMLGLGGAMLFAVRWFLRLLEAST